MTQVARRKLTVEVANQVAALLRTGENITDTARAVGLHPQSLKMAVMRGHSPRAALPDQIVTYAHEDGQRAIAERRLATPRPAAPVGG